MVRARVAGDGAAPAVMLLAGELANAKATGSVVVGVYAENGSVVAFDDVEVFRP